MASNKVMSRTTPYIDAYDAAAVTHNTPLYNSTLFNSSMTNSSDDYYYVYDYDESVNNLPMNELLPVALVYGLTLLLGVVGNALVIFSIMRYRRMQNVTNIFLTSLSTADLLLVLICIPIKVSQAFNYMSYYYML